jgi:S-DNA-T family DNA segregation ATPase FtsK/SpoIIIE
MGRKKKQKSEDYSERKNRKPKLNIHGDAKRGIVAIFLFALSVLFVLGFFEKAGVLGTYLDMATSALFGWGKWISPFILIIGGIILLFRKEASFYVTRLLGLMLAFASILGFLHIFLDDSKFLKFAKNGEGGGYVGYFLASSLFKYSGIAAGSVILAALFLIGAIVAFNFSLVGFFSKLFGKENPEEDEEDEDEEDDDEEEIKKEEPKKEEERKPQFVKGPEEEKPAGGFLKNKFGFGKKENPDEFAPKTEETANFSSNQTAWKFPPLSLLADSSGKAYGGDVIENEKIIVDTLGHFGIQVEPAGNRVGPTITQYTFSPAVGIKLSKITALNTNLAMALAAPAIRIEAPISGKSLVGIEVPNKGKETVCLKELLESNGFRGRKNNLTLCLGKDVNGDYIFGDLNKMPHLLIAGTTGSGKSICIDSVLTALLYQNSPEDLKLILVDPKRVTLTLYNDIPHLLANVIVENSRVISALKWAIGEMENRYKLLQETKSQNIASYHQKLISGKKRTVTNPETGETHEEDLKKMPYIVIVIDELADLMMSHGKEVEGAIIRIAQMSRAVGIHLIISTQRPSVEVITGLIKSNISTRIAFRVPSQIDSRTILDANGADKLLGNGDMLYMSAEFSGQRRIQGTFITEPEIKKVVKFIKAQKAETEEEIGEDIVSIGEGAEKKFEDRIDFDSMKDAEDEDSMFEDAKKVVAEAGKASATLLQTRLRVGYARAARLLNIMEDRGIIGPSNGAKPREVYISEKNPEYENGVDDQEKRDKWQM